MGGSRRTVVCILVLTLALSSRAELTQDLLEELQDDTECISTPAEFKAAFEAREPRCVSSSLFGRIASGPTATHQYSVITKADYKLAFFLSGNDVLEKYLRFGYPQVVGTATPTNNSGIADRSGLALLQQVGYPMEYADVSKAYVLHVVSRDTLANSTAALAPNLTFGGGVPPLSADWDGVRAYFEYIYAAAGLNITDEIIGIIKNTSFAALTGCPAQCAYESNAFPSAAQKTPVFVAKRVNSTCPPATNGTWWEDPSAIDGDSELCSIAWKTALAAASALFKPCNATTMGAAGPALAGLLAGAKSPLEAALLFRAFVYSSCAGSFNSLFSGDGFTYTGFGGMFSPLGSEFIVSPFAFAPDADVVRIPFCISGTNGGKPNATGICELPAPAPMPTSRKLLVH